MSHEDVLVYIPLSLVCCEYQQLACIRFNYQIEDLPQLPIAGELYTGLTLEQAKTLAAFLDGYIENNQLSRQPVTLKHKH